MVGLSAGRLTARDRSTLLPDQPDPDWAVEPVELLDPEAARRLLCWHAFRAEAPPPGYDESVCLALLVCDGLPLALRLIGGALRSRPAPTAAMQGEQPWSAPGGGTTSRQTPWCSLPATDHQAGDSAESSMPGWVSSLNQVSCPGK